MKLIHTGSVKNLYEAEDAGQLWFEYTDDYSVFDWGKMPDTIPGKGAALAGLGEFFFRELENPARWQALGLAQRPDIAPVIPVRHHLVRREGQRLLVQRVQVPRLTTGLVGADPSGAGQSGAGQGDSAGTLIYDYSYPAQARQLIPLEVIFRFGVPAGSSLLSRKDWYPFPIHEGAEFDQPLIEFSTKLETRDRMLSYQEAALVLKGSAQRLSQVHARTRAIALFLQALFRQRGLKLWDGKVEWALWDDGSPQQGGLCLVDSIGPDELRVSQGEAVMSKQFLRDFYLGSPWEQALVKAKDLAKSRGTTDWKTIVREELKQAPQLLPLPYLSAAQALYQDFHAILVEGRTSTRFAAEVEKLGKR